MDYIGEGMILPVPFNMLGFPKALIRRLQKCCASCCCSSDDTETPEDGNPDVAPEGNGGHQNGIVSIIYLIKKIYGFLLSSFWSSKWHCKHNLF